MEALRGELLIVGEVKPGEMRRKKGGHFVRQFQCPWHGQILYASGELGNIFVFDRACTSLQGGEVRGKLRKVVWLGKENFQVQ